jgi:hypothetical protein
MRKSVITAQLCNLDMDSPAGCDELCDDLGDGGIAATENDSEGKRSIKIRMCGRDDGISCPYQEPISTKTPPVLNGRYAIALGKPPTPKDEEEDEDPAPIGRGPKYPAMRNVSIGSCRHAIVKAILKGRSTSSVPDDAVDISLWEQTSEIDDRKIFVNNSWGSNGHRATLTLIDGFLSVQIDQLEDLPF